MRSAFDKFISWTGLLMAVVLLVAGGLLWWAHSFIGDQVNEQLTMQGITMPEGDALASLPKADAEAPALRRQHARHRPRGQGLRQPPSPCT